ncbi:MAG: amidohydrolase family protein [Gammaproteobacteria bacterium]
MGVEFIPFPQERSIPPITWRPPAGTRVISADDHYQEPAGLYEERLPAKYKDRAPRIFRDGNGNWQMTIDGASRASKGVAKLANVTRDRDGGHDLAARLADMDAELIEKAVVYPQKSPPILGMPDKDLVFACCDVYNEWIAEVGRASGGRIVGIGFLPTLYRPEASRDYVQKIKALGLKGMQLPSAPSEVQYNRSAMEPLWSAIEDSGLPLSFHVRGHTTTGAGALGSDLTTSFAPFRRLLSTLLFSGILERHPGLRVVFAEGGISWVPSNLHDADRVQRIYGRMMTPQLAEPPSRYWHRQCFATFGDDPCGIEQIDRIGAGHAMWSADYPHPEGTLGESVAIIRYIFDTVGVEKAQQIVGGNAARIWGI